MGYRTKVAIGLLLVLFLLVIGVVLATPHLNVAASPTHPYHVAWLIDGQEVMLACCYQWPDYHFVAASGPDWLKIMWMRLVVRWLNANGIPVG